MSQKEDHRNHINSEDWQAHKESLIEQRGRECEQCCIDCKGKQIHLHHKNYDQDYSMENDNDMMLLCEDCHARMHMDPEMFQKETLLNGDWE